MQVQRPGITSTHPTLQAARDVLTKGGITKLIRAAYRAAPLVRYLPEHRRMMRLLQSPPVDQLVARRPKLGYKYLYRPYLVQSFSRKTRLECLDHHYRFLADRVRDDFFARIYDGEVELWRQTKDGWTATITLAFPVDWEHDYEGDLLLNANVRGERIYSVTFSIVSGQTIGVDAGHVALVTAIQGTAGMADRIKDAKEHYGDLSAPVLLLAAIEGVALAMDIPLLAGIGLDQQVQKQTWGDDRFTFDYDRFWTQAAGERTNGSYYTRPVPEQIKPIEEIKGKYRQKTLFRRGIKASIRQASQASFNDQCLNPQFTRRRQPDEEFSQQPEG
jgi:uncharacterized protein VirK/YbjX